MVRQAKLTTTHSSTMGIVTAMAVATSCRAMRPERTAMVMTASAAVSASRRELWNRAVKPSTNGKAAAVSMPAIGSMVARQPAASAKTPTTTTAVDSRRVGQRYRNHGAASATHAAAIPM